MSEYGPILDSNNPLSLNSESPDHGKRLLSLFIQCFSLKQYIYLYLFIFYIYLYFSIFILLFAFFFSTFS